MKKLFFYLLFSIVINYSDAQINLVRNPSFEQHTACPFSWDQVNFANYWSCIDTIECLGTCAPDYCNVCGTGQASVPLGGIVGTTHAYNHYPRTGNGMMQQMLYVLLSGGGSARDYLQGRLYYNLISGHSYCVTFYVVNTIHSGYAINSIGAYLDNGIIDTTTMCNWAQTEYAPQILDTTVIFDTVNWTKIQGTFVANGTERFITLGNFFDTSHTTHVYLTPHNSSIANYLVDDVSVIDLADTAYAGIDRITSPYGDSVWVGDTTGYLPCYWYANGVLIDSNTAGFKVHPDTTTRYVMQLDVCGHISTDTAVVWVYPVGMRSVGCRNIEVFIYPNPVTNMITIEGAIDCKIVICDMVGNVVLNELGQQRLSLNISSLTKGVYSVEVRDIETGIKVMRKIIKE